MTPCQRVGILYSVWHWPAWRATADVATDGGTYLTVEDVLRSRRETLTGGVGRHYADILNVGALCSSRSCSLDDARRWKDECHLTLIGIGLLLGRTKEVPVPVCDC